MQSFAPAIAGEAIPANAAATVRVLRAVMLEFLPLVEVERAVDRAAGRPTEVAARAVERRRPVPVVDRRPAEVAVAAVVEDAAVVPAVLVVQRRLAGAGLDDLDGHDD